MFTLTRENLGELGWVSDFAVDQGARLLQIHPLAEVGTIEVRPLWGVA